MSHVTSYEIFRQSVKEKTQSVNSLIVSDVISELSKLSQLLSEASEWCERS